MGGVKVATGSRGLTVGAASRKIGSEYRALVHMSIIEFHRPFLLGSCILLDPLPRSGGLSLGGGRDRRWGEL